MISNGTAAGGLRTANNYFVGGAATIAPTSALPTITDPVVIDASKQPGFAATPIIESNAAGGSPATACRSAPAAASFAGL
jgi:hypothetical protein